MCHEPNTFICLRSRGEETEILNVVESIGNMKMDEPWNQTWRLAREVASMEEIDELACAEMTCRGEEREENLMLIQMCQEQIHFVNRIVTRIPNGFQP